MNNKLNESVFQNEIDYKTFEKLLETLNHITVVYISREDYNWKNWEILEETWNDKFWVFYELFLPIDCNNWELLSIIDFLNKKLKLKKYSKINDLIEKTKIIIWIISKREGYNAEKYLKKMLLDYDINEELKGIILETKLKTNTNIKEFIKSIKIDKNDKKLSFDEHFKNGTMELSKDFLEEFELIFFRKWVNMLRFWMETITKIEHESINVDCWKVLLNENIDNLDEKTRLLRDKIWIDRFKKNLIKLREIWCSESIEELEIEAINCILQVLNEYPKQITDNNYWFQPNKIITHKEIYCVWFSLLWHSFLSELNIVHKWLHLHWHSAIEVIIWWKNYYFDPTKFDKIIEFNFWNEVWIYREIKLLNWNSNEQKYVISWEIETTLLSQIYNNKWNILYKNKQYFEAISMYDKAINLNDFADVYYNKWIVLQYLKQYDDAIKMHDKAIELNPNYSKPYYNKWFILENLI